MKPVIDVIYRVCDDELTAIFPSLPATNANDTLEGFVWADGFVSLDIGYARRGVPAEPMAYVGMHTYLTRRFEDATLRIVTKITQHHRNARLMRH